MHLSTASHQLIISSALLLLLCASASGDYFMPVMSPVTPPESAPMDLRGMVCCKKITRKEPQIKINSCFFVQEISNCLKSVVLIDDLNKMHCIHPKAPWLSARIKRLEEIGVQCTVY
ncbi:chemokine (C-C motif) ligand 34b, duplicate 9 precursor [Danio rerio]|uniref:Chemokine (C-C motif) ligand 34b, duplicate 9 precursor n=1 Tax=Danio rerio TaxID=7955 RepID=A9ZPE2_DANRE|nr:chemokine (C-C motif) ligand 34b, duplicate 9 precursor [Danio rerio]BAF98250.1 chemokine CCL-C24b [Danio rerio]|eukprot:NP_001171407.1 chemokine (C-C motif) ligand 34b, duplicate 9 precursor [Danio rerio]